MPKRVSTTTEKQRYNGQNSESPIQGETLLTVNEVARRLRVDSTTVRRWVTTGALEAVILPHSGKRLGYRIRQSTLNQIIQTPPVTLQ